MRRPLVAALMLGLAWLAAGLATASLAQPAPDAADLLFERPQWGTAAPGATLTYRYARKASDEASFGPSYDDRIVLKLDKGATAEQRTVEVDMFSGAHHRATGAFEDVTSNPVLVLFLENHIDELSRRLRANPRYLKNAIRAALRDKAVIQPADMALKGRTMPASRITVTPFAEDPNKARLNGLEGLTYEFVVADGLPGRIADLHAMAPLGDGNVGLDERLVYDPDND